MRYVVFLALAVVLALFCAAPASAQVHEDQLAILLEMADQWPMLKEQVYRPWNEENLRRACDNYLAPIKWCNASGWVTQLAFSSYDETPFLGQMAPSVGKMVALNRLIFTNVLNGTLHDVDLSQLTQVDYLSLAGNSFSSAPAASWSGMTALQTFAFSSAATMPGQHFPAFLEDLPKLETIVFRTINLTGTIPSWVGSLPRLKRLELQYIPLLQGPIPSTIAESSTLTTLSLVSLASLGQTSSPAISSDLPSNWTQAINLEKFEIRLAPITGSIPAMSFPKLKSFAIQSTKIAGTIPQEFVDSPLLESIEVTRSDLSGTLPAPTSVNTSKLGVYAVTESKLEAIHEDVLTVPSLEVFSVSDNKIFSNLHFNIGSGNSPLTSLDVSFNNFSGTIPAELFTRMPLLTMFYVQGNQLTGEVPIEVAERTNWIAFDVSSNFLSGRFPDVGKWHENTNMNTIIISNNNFTGTIPTGFFNKTSAWYNFFFDGNALDVCAGLPSGYTFPASFAYYCSVMNQKPTECGCAWPGVCTGYKNIHPTCPAPPTGSPALTPSAPKSATPPPPTSGAEKTSTLFSTVFTIALSAFLVVF